MMRQFRRMAGKSAYIGGAMLLLVSWQSTIALAETAPAHVLKVASSIAPISVLVRQIGGDAIDQQLILPASQSAHHATLRPSQTKIIAESDVIFAIDPLAEGGLAKFMSASPQKWVLFAHEMKDQLARRIDEEDHHDDHDDHKHHDDHDGHKDHDDHDGHKDHDAHESFYDYHLFFSPVKMRQMAAIIQEELRKRAPEQSAVFQENYQSVIAMLDAASAALSKKLAATGPNHFIAMHDITLYLEQDFNLEAVGFVLGHDHGKPSAKTLRALQETAKTKGVKCIFYEPQIGKRLISQIAADIDLPMVTLDPLGLFDDEDIMIDAYWHNVTASFERCFAM